MKYDKCITKGCNREVSIFKMNSDKGLCWTCWERECRAKDKRGERNYSLYLEGKSKDPIEQHINECVDQIKEVIDRGTVDPLRGSLEFWPINLFLKMES